jgi:phage FluMu protein Com
MQRQEFRCGNCGKKLGEGRLISLSIKCSRCKTINHFKAGPELPDPTAIERPQEGIFLRGNQ